MAKTRLADPSIPTPLRKVPAAALRAVLREGYAWKSLRRDVGAGFLVGVIALPLAMALSIAVGLPPQQGLYTAIFAGFLCALLGGSRIQVVGPTAAFIVILAPIVAKYGFGGLLVCGAMAGLILMGIALMRFGRLIEFIPFPVTTGFTSGIAVVIAGLQVKDVFGLRMDAVPEDFFGRMAAYWRARDTASAAELGVALLTLALLFLPRLPKRWLARLPRLLRRVPAPLFAFPAAALAAWALQRHWPGFHVDTLNDRFHSLVDGVTVAGIPRVPPSFLLPWNAAGAGGQPFTLSWGLFRDLIPGAFTVAMLAAIESLLSAVVADGMARTRHDPDAELLALGISNVVTPFFGGIPATGAIARTATNFRFGGRSPFAAMAHALTVLLAVLIFAPVLGYLPMASMAALLLMVAWNMSEAEHFVFTLRVAPKSDVLVLLTCFALTVGVNMVVSIMVGVILGALLFMRRMARLTEGKMAKPDPKALAGTLPAGVVFYEINGPFFFGAAERAMSAIRNIDPEMKVVLFELSRVPAVDVTAVVAMEGALDELYRHGIKVVIIGAKVHVQELFERAGLRPQAGRLAYAATIAEALSRVKMRVDRPKPGNIGPIRFNVLNRQKTGAKKIKRQAG